MTAVLQSVHLTAFKSFRDATLPIHDLTLLVGRNGSGKSNALDALWVLSRMAVGVDLRDAIADGRNEISVRGGAEGCPPFGDDTFRVGCTVLDGEAVVRLDVAVRVRPTIQIVEERMSRDGHLVYETEPPAPGLLDIAVRWNNWRQGPNPRVNFRSDVLLAQQAAARIAPDSDAAHSLHRSCDAVLAVLRGLFLLDPVPHRMRDYVPRQDRRTRRDGSNISAAIADLIGEPAMRIHLRTLLGGLMGAEVHDLDVSASDMGDVILRVTEGREPRPVSARLMSDGTLRFLAIVVALMQESREEGAGPPMVVIEEIENGLHASQAATLVREVRRQVQGRRVRVLATAHSPAVLDALSGDEHAGVVVCQRDESGLSTLTRLTELHDYLAIVAGGTVGEAAVDDRLRQTAPKPSAALDVLMGGAGPAR